MSASHVSASSKHGYSSRPTKIDMLKESQIKRRADGEFLILREDNVTAIVALLDSLQDVLGIILAATASPDRADLLTFRRDRERLSRVVGRNRGVGSL